MDSETDSLIIIPRMARFVNSFFRFFQFFAGNYVGPEDPALTHAFLILASTLIPASALIAALALPGPRGWSGPGQRPRPASWLKRA